MSTAPVKNVPSAETDEMTERRFRQLEAIWEADTMFLSDANKIIEHSAFQEIIAMGEAVIPFMLRDLEKEPHGGRREVASALGRDRPASRP